MQNIFLLHNSKWFFPFWALLFVLSLILLWFSRKKWRQGFDTFFWLIILALVIVYCPLLARILIPHFLPSYGEYERLSWVFFEIPLLSYVLIMLTKSFSSQRLQRLFVAAFLTVIILIGSPDNRNFFQNAPNQYKISPDAVSVCNKINSLSPKGPVILCVQFGYWAPYYSGNGLDGALYYGIRMNESRFRLRHVYVPPERYSWDVFKIADDLPTDIDYYICPKEDIVYRELERLGYKYVDESENFAIFKNQNKQEGEMGS